MWKSALRSQPLVVIIGSYDWLIVSSSSFLEASGLIEPPMRVSEHNRALGLPSGVLCSAHQSLDPRQGGV